VGTLLTGAYMARSLRLLWRGPDETLAVAGGAWMRAGILGLVVPAAGLGLAFGSIEAILDLSMPDEGIGVVLLGLFAGLGGLLLGSLVSAQRLLGPIHQWAESGLSIAGGLAAWVGRPAMAVARGCERLEQGLYVTVLRTGHASLVVANLVRAGDERRINGLIFALVAGVQAMGARARTLQSGLIHHSLAISAVASAVTLVVLFLASLSF